MSKKFELAIFDLDGTLLDTSEGIFVSVKYAAKACGLRPLSEEELKSFIGPPVQDSFGRVYGLNEEERQRIAAVFRERYSTVDLLKATPYEGIFSLFESLNRSGVQTAVATYKREDYAVKLLKHFGFDRYTRLLYGSDMKGVLKKKDIIRKCIEESGRNASEKIVMIGDTASDAVAAQEAGVSFIGVTYGFGFGTNTDCNKFPNKGTATDVNDLTNLLI